MNILLIKLIMMPLVIAMVTLAGRRWGSGIAGIISSLPWVAGPIILFIAVEQGSDFAANIIPGVMVGIVGWLAYCITYLYVGSKYNVLVSAILAYTAYFVVGFLLFDFIDSLSIFQWLIISLILITLTILKFPAINETSKDKGKPLKYDIYLRMITITLFVLAITYFAKTIGEKWSGILTPIPVITAVLGMFTHYTQGIEETKKTYKGLLIGVYGFNIFLFSQSYFLKTTSIANAMIFGFTLNLIITFSMRYLFVKLNGRSIQ